MAKILCVDDDPAEVDGAKAVRALYADPRTAQYPIMPKGLRYVAFLEIPQKLDSLLPTIAKTVAVREAEPDAAQACPITARRSLAVRPMTSPGIAGTMGRPLLGPDAPAPPPERTSPWKRSVNPWMWSRP